MGLFSCGLFLLLLICASSEAEVVSIDAKATKGLLETGYVYLDVRTGEEFKKGHVDAEKVINVPYLFNTPEGRVKNPEFLKEVLAVCNEEDHIVVGCQTGGRSLAATAELLKVGFKDISNMAGGYRDWEGNSFPVKVEEERKGDEL